MAKKIADFFPQEEETVIVQAKISKELAGRVKAELAEDKMGWKEFMEAACLWFLSQREKK